MKTRILARQAVITAEMKYEDMEKIKKYAPDTMTMCDEDGNETFRVSVDQHDSVSPIGITFTDDGGQAMARIMIPSDVEDKKAYIAENFGVTITKAGEIIENMKAALEDVNQTIAAVVNSIETVD